MIEATSALLTAWSDYCSSTGRTGLLFLDGLNEAQEGGSGQLPRLIGLLPTTLPPHVTVVFAAPNFSNIAVHLFGRVKAQNVLALPPLTEAASIAYCQRELSEARATPTLIRRICDKALGHPLYLRYLIEYANASPEDNALDDFPKLTGPIEDYYETIWTRLLPDTNAIQLIAIMARLRSSLEFAHLVKALNAAEQSVFTSTIVKIRHLLSEPEKSGIYHPSFATFAIAHTKELDTTIQGRLAEFCRKEPKPAYSTANLIFHLLRGDDSARASGPSACTQEWVDRCVLLGTEPDVLLSDIREVLAASLHYGPATEVIRILLLSQRVGFRYDSLFAQSARLIAEALVAVERPTDALKHIVRYKSLIVHPEEALQVAFVLIEQSHQDEAISLLQLLHDRILEAHIEPNMALGDFMDLCVLHIRTLFLLRSAGAGVEMQQVLGVCEYVKRKCRENLPNEPELVGDCIGAVGCLSTSYFLAFRDTYASLAQIKKMHGAEISAGYLSSLAHALLDFDETVEKFRLPKDRKAFPQLFADVEALRRKGGVLSQRVKSRFVDALVRFGAPSESVRAFSQGTTDTPSAEISIRAKNEVDVDFRALHEAARNWRISAFVKDDLPCPEIPSLGPTTWLSSVRGLFCALFWCEGRARRAKADGNQELHDKCLAVLRDAIPPAFSFSLANRVSWEASYAIPENLFPFLYRCLAGTVLDCFPEEVSHFLERISENSKGQLGLYSEGYRETAHEVIEEVTRRGVLPQTSGLVLTLLQQWRDHVIDGVENRHELVPELLKLIPFFVKMGAVEEGERLYHRVLSVSMGPSWYKEGQFGLMTEVLANMPASDDLAGRAQRIAAYLERASGEMTFQRYVRDEKATLLGELFRRGMCREGCHYFTRQSCGSPKQLLAEAESGHIDKPAPRRGMRFPGGALDEQAAILQLVRNAKTADWRLRWALLEVFHCGDERHLDGFASEYANIVNEAGQSEESITAMVQRAEQVLGAETSPDLKGQFAAAFGSKLLPIHHGRFATLLASRPQTPAEVMPAEGAAPKAPRQRDEDADGLFLPGTIGRHSALGQTDKLVAEAEEQLRLGNVNAAKEKAVAALAAAQEGGWGIWDHFSGAGERAKEILQLQTTDALEIIRLYSQLLLAERHAPSWHLAECLIGRITSLLDGDARLLLLDTVLNHVQLLVGDAKDQVEMFSFLAAPAPQNSASKELFPLLLWMTEHPKWLRRDHAAATLAWVIRDTPGLVEEAAKIAFGMTEGYGADVLAGALDGLSIQMPAELWEKLSPHLQVAAIASDCKHLSRLAALHSIATRAGKAGMPAGEGVAVRIEALFTGRKTGATETEAALPDWANCIQAEWSALHGLLPDMQKVAVELEDELKKLCEPLTIEDLHELEVSVSQSFRENQDNPLGRWEGKVRYALNIAAFNHVTKSTFSAVVAQLRIWNPSLPELTLNPDFDSLGPGVISSIANNNFAGLIGTSDSFFLNYVEFFENLVNEKLCHIEVVAVIVPSSLRRRGFFLPDIDATFGATEIPDPSRGNAQETCCSLRPEHVFFGWMTPGLPRTEFARIIGASDEAFFRANWRSGRRNEVRRLGQPIREGCLLSIKRSAVKLPATQKFAWIIYCNGRLAAMVDEQNNRLY